MSINNRKKIRNSNLPIYRIYQQIHQLIIKRHVYGLTSPLRVLPDFFVIGAAKAGTTSLYHYLDEHPCVYSSTYKEVGFFDTNFELGLNWYKSFFPLVFTKEFSKIKKHCFMAYDVTPSYIRRPWVARRISSLFPRAKIIAILRNPIDRTYSHYHMGIRSGFEKRSFEEVISEDMKNIEKSNRLLKDDNYMATVIEKSYVGRGFYAEQLITWFNLFSKEQILILTTEDLELDTQKTLDRIFEFLHLQKYELKNREKRNVGSYEKMNNETRKILVDFFKPYNEQLYLLLNQKFDWDK